MTTPHLITSDGHPKFATFISDGSEIICVGTSLRRFNVSDGQLLATEPLLKSPIVFAVAHDRNSFAIATKDAIEIRDTKTFQLISTSHFATWPTALAFSPEGNLIAVRDSATVFVHRTDDLQLVAELGCDGSVLGDDAIFLPDGRIAVTSATGVDILDLVTAKVVAKLSLGENDLPNAKRLNCTNGSLYAATEFFAYEFDLTEFRIRRRVRCDFLESIIITPETGWLLSGNISGQIQVIDFAREKPLRRLRGHALAISSLDTDPCGRWLVSVGDGQDLRFWDLRRAISDPLAYSCTGDEFLSFEYASPCGIQFVSDGTELLSAKRGSIDRWSVANFQLTRTFPIVEGQGRVQFISADEAFAGLWRNGEQTTFQAFLFDTQCPRTHHIFDFLIEYPTFARLNRTKKIVAAFAGERLVLLSYPTGKLFHSIVTHDGPIEDSRFCGLEFSPDDLILYTAGRDGTLNQWAPDTGKLIQTYLAPDKIIESFCVSPDGTILAINEKQRILIFDVQSWRTIRVIPRTERAPWSSMALSADNRLLVFATTHSHDIRIYNVSTGALERIFKGHTSGVTDVCISPNGALVASTAHDDTLKIWKMS